MKCDDEIAGMPSANTQSENKKYSLKWRELAPTREQQYCQPQRQHRADAVTDQLEDFEWGHESVGEKQEAGAGGRRQEAVRGSRQGKSSYADRVKQSKKLLPPGACLPLLPSCLLPSAYWLLAVLRVGMTVISIRRLRDLPASVVFAATGFDGPMPLA